MFRKSVLLFVLATLIFGYGQSTEMVEMRDGIDLATEIYLPSYGTPPFPVILERTPYGRHIGSELASFICDVRGYAFVSQNVRGCRDSEGEPMVFLSDGWGELQDGYDCIDWVSEQEWCNGRIGMEGASAPGMTQYMAAGAGHPALDCIVPVLAGPSMYHDVAYNGGCFRKVLVEGWLSGIDTPWLIDTVISHPIYGGIWQDVNLAERWDEAAYPAWHVAAWYDMYTDGQITAFQEMQARHGNQKLIIIPCGHGDAVGTRNQGDLVYPENAVRTEDELIMMAEEWYSYWLKDGSAEIMAEPPIKYYITGDCDTEDTTRWNRWLTAWDWPPYSTEDKEFFVTEDGVMDSMLPMESSSESYTYDPDDPSPTYGGREFIGMDDIGYGPKNQSVVESRDDNLIFETPVLTEPLAVIGKIRMMLYASTDRLDTDFAVRVTDVYPDGRPILMTDNIIKARYRRGFDTEVLMEPDVMDSMLVDVWSIAHVFNTGHKIRVIITSSNFPRFEINPNTGETPGRNPAEKLIAENTIYWGPDAPTRLILPINDMDTWDIAEKIDIPETFAITVSPNPFNSACLITSSIPDARVTIFDTKGNQVDQLPLNSGAAKWQPSDNLPSGIYLAIVEGNSSRETMKLVYLK